MLLFFDTETSGLPGNHRAPLNDLANWPRLVQIAWLLTDVQGGRQQAVEAIIRPDGFTIPVDLFRKGLGAKPTVARRNSLHHYCSEYRKNRDPWL